VFKVCTTFFIFFFHARNIIFFQVSVKIFRPNGKHTVVEYPGSIKPAVKVEYNGFDHYYSVVDVAKGACGQRC
jgi:hypothetical protein